MSEPWDRITDDMLKEWSDKAMHMSEYHMMGEAYRMIIANGYPEAAALAQSFLDRADEDFTWVDPEDIKTLARAVLGK